LRGQHPGWEGDCASKFAVLDITESVRIECRDNGVRSSMVLPTFANTELTAGVAGAKELKDAEPENIPDAIVGLIENPPARASFPRVTGFLVGPQKFKPQCANEYMTHKFGVEKAFFEDIDVAKRQAYKDGGRATEPES
jgi:NAD(P)-dependent dehydrogenase (short-subunit alcohol dehydrogenase family)